MRAWDISRSSSKCTVAVSPIVYHPNPHASLIDEISGFCRSGGLHFLDVLQLICVSFTELRGFVLHYQCYYRRAVALLVRSGMFLQLPHYKPLLVLIPMLVRLPEYGGPSCNGVGFHCSRYALISHHRYSIVTHVHAPNSAFFTMLVGLSMGGTDLLFNHTRMRH